jgi:putative component of membrane protein insertase Oxa1/YidC/SpoIIIJ protein YidD
MKTGPQYGGLAKGVAMTGSAPAVCSSGLVARVLIALVVAYQRSDWRRRRSRMCGFLPSCSEYSVRALQKYGAVKGSVLTVRRLRRCNPTYTGPRIDFP